MDCWICVESPNPAKKGRENEFITLSRPIDRVWLRAGFEKRESIKSSEEGRENMCRICYLNHPALNRAGCRYSCRVRLPRFRLYNLSGVTNPAWGEKTPRELSNHGEGRACSQKDDGFSKPRQVSAKSPSRSRISHRKSAFSH